MSEDNAATGRAQAFKSMMKDASAEHKEVTQNAGEDAPVNEDQSEPAQKDLKGFEGFAAIPSNLAQAFETQNTAPLGLEPAASTASVQRKKRKAHVRFRKTAENTAYRALKLFYERIGVVKQKDGLERLSQKYGTDPQKLLKLLNHKYNPGGEDSDPRIPEAMDLLDEKLAEIEKARRVRDAKIAAAEGRRTGRQGDEEEDEAEKKRRPKGPKLLARSKRGMCNAWTLRASTKKLKDSSSLSAGANAQPGSTTSIGGQSANANAFDALMGSDSSSEEDDDDDSSRLNSDETENDETSTATTSADHNSPEGGATTQARSGSPTLPASATVKEVRVRSFF